MKKPVLLPVLTILLTAAILFATALGLQPIAAKNGQAEHIWLLETLLPGGSDFVLEAYSGEDQNIRSVHKADEGYVIETSTYGYAGDIIMYIGVTNDGKVTGLVVRDMQETFGLGTQALNHHEFLAQFLNGSGNFEITAGDHDAFSGATADTQEATGQKLEVDALSGATVTSKAIARAVNSAVAYVTGADAVSAATSWGG